MTSPAVTSGHCSLPLPGALACATRSARFNCSCRPRLSTPTSALAVDRPRCAAAATRRHRAESWSVCVAVVVRGLLNSLSARHKAALIHDVIADNKLDILLLTETWIPSDAPDAAKLDFALSGYTVVHRHRAASTVRRGGGLAVIHRDSFRATPVDVGDYSEFESLALRVVGHRSTSFVVVCIYRPPGTVTSAFTEQLSDLLDRLATLDTRFIVAGDFNATGDSKSRTA